MIDILTKAKMMYADYSGNHPTLHCNTFPSWDELSLDQQQIWIAKAASNGATRSDYIAR